MLKKLFSHSAIYGLAPQMPKIASIFILPIITPFLTETDFGIYGLITATMGAIAVFGTLGLNVILGNTFFRSPNYYQWAWRQIYGFLMLWNIPFALISGIIIALILPKEEYNNLFWIILLNVAPLFLFGPTSILGSYLYQYKKKPLQVAWRSASSGLIAIFLNLLFIAYFKLGYLGWFASTAIAQILLQFSYWIPLNLKYKLKPIFNFKWRFIKEKLKVSLPTVPHYYGAYLLSSSDRLIMKFTGVPITEIGYYNAANTLSNPFQLMGTASGQAIGPMLMESYKKNDLVNVKKLIFSLQIVFLVAAFICSIWMKELFQLLIKNDELNTAYPIAILLVMAYTYRPMYFGANYFLFYYEKTKKLARITFTAGISNVLLNIIFLPIYGIQFAAYSTFACFMFMGYSNYFSKDFKTHNPINFYPIIWLLITIIVTGLAYYLVELSISIKIISSILLGIVGLLALLKFSKGKK